MLINNCNKEYSRTFYTGLGCIWSNHNGMPINHRIMCLPDRDGDNIWKFFQYLGNFIKPEGSWKLSALPPNY